jgi:MFS family permease
MPPPRYAAFRSAPFRALWLGMVISNVGSQMQIVGQGWLVRDLSAEPLSLGLVSLASAVPMILLTPIGGALADRFPRRRLLAMTQVCMLVQRLVLAGLTLSGHVELWHLYVLAAVNAMLLAVDNPTRHALLPDLVSPAELPGAIMLNSVVWSGSALFGPAIGGLLLGPFGSGGLFLINAVAGIAMLYTVAVLGDIDDRPAVRPDPILAGLLNGIRYASRDGLTRAVLLLFVLASLFGRSYQTLMPIFARDVLAVGPEGYGLLLAAPGAGAILAAMGLAAVRSSYRPDRLMVGAMTAFCLLVVFFAISRSFVLDLVSLLIAGGCFTAFTAAGSTLLQLHSPRELRGRVMSLATVANIGMNQLGGLIGAAAATVIGAPAAVAAAALTALAVGLAIGLAPAWRNAAARVRDGGAAHAEPVEVAP